MDKRVGLISPGIQRVLEKTPNQRDSFIKPECVNPSVQFCVARVGEKAF